MAFRISVLLLAAVLTVCPGFVQQAAAQGSPDPVQGASLGTPAGNAAPEDEGSHELSAFFLIGIMINIAALALFAAWAAREWKKRKPAGPGGSR